METAVNDVFIFKIIQIIFQKSLLKRMSGEIIGKYKSKI